MSESAATEGSEPAEERPPGTAVVLRADGRALPEWRRRLPALAQRPGVQLAVSAAAVVGTGLLANSVGRVVRRAVSTPPPVRVALSGYVVHRVDVVHHVVHHVVPIERA